jgi:hypothetical protein
MAMAANASHDDGPANGNRVGSGNRAVGQLVHGDHGQLRDARTHAAADEAQRHAFGKHLPDQPHAAGSKRSAHGEFLLTAQAAGNQQIGDVGAGNQQHQGQRRQQAVKHGLHRAGEDLLIKAGAEADRALVFVRGICAAMLSSSRCACSGVTPGRI